MNEASPAIVPNWWSLFLTKINPVILPRQE